MQICSRHDGRERLLAGKSDPPIGRISRIT